MSRRDDGIVGVEPGGLPSTHWSVVVRAGDSDAETARRTVKALLERYYEALRVHLVAVKRIPRDEAEDILHGFIASKVLEDGLLARANQKRGKFRTFLLTALDRYLVDEVRRRQAAKRCPEGSLLTLDESPAAKVAARGQPHPFDVVWARTVVQTAVGRMKEECRRTRRRDQWEVFECRVLKPAIEGVEPLSYEALVRRFRLATPAQAHNLLITAKRTYRRCLRSVVAEYTMDEEEALREVEALGEILAQAGA